MKLIMIVLIMLFIILISQQTNSLTVINEIMYDPNGEDNNKEFLEIYSTDYKNLTNFSIEDFSGSKDRLELLRFYNSSYSLIVEDGFDYSSINATIYSVGNTIGNNLNNDKDALILRDNLGKIIDLVSYSSDYGASNNGKSLERISFDGNSNELSNWKESSDNGGTPGINNSILDIKFKDILINEFLPDPIGNDDSNQPDGEWIEVYNSKEDDINLEGFMIEDNSGKKIIISNTNTNSLKINKKDFLIVYMNGVNGFLNNEGFEKIKFLYGNKIIDEVSYTNSKEGLSWQRIDDSWKILKPSLLKENIEEKEFNKSISSIKILKVYTGSDNILKFGDQFEVRLEIYKGETNKNSIDVWVQKDSEKISKITNFNIYHKFENYTINVPLILYPNCDNGYEGGEYEVVVEGLDVKDKEYIDVEGFDNKLCNEKTIVKEEKEISESIAAKQNIAQDNEDMSEIMPKQDKIKSEVQPRIVYESSDLKAKNSSNYILISVLLFIIIAILFRKGL